MDNGFSLASVILSYFLVGGGMFAATLVGGYLELSGELALYGLLAAGAFVGGFIAARASRGSTILEPAIGAVAVVATLVALAAGTPIGKLIWAFAQDETMKFVGVAGGTGAVGALLGAFLSEKAMGEATRSSIPWLLYTALSAFSACLLATLLASLVVAGDNPATRAGADQGTLLLIGIGAGCLMSGLAVGASAHTRPLVTAFLGGGGGVAGYFALMARTQPAADRDRLIGLIALVAGGAIVTLIGTAVGWVMVGRRAAG
jgi:hypothetical protein